MESPNNRRDFCQTLHHYCSFSFPLFPTPPPFLHSLILPLNLSYPSEKNWPSRYINKAWHIKLQLRLDTFSHIKARQSSPIGRKRFQEHQSVFLKNPEYQSRDGPTHNDLGPPTLITNYENTL